MAKPRCYVVKPFRRDITDAELLADIKSVADRLNTDRLAANRYDELGQFSSMSARKHFGSWTRALQQLNLRPAHAFNITRAQLLKDLRRVAAELNTKTLTVNAYRAHGHYDFGQLKRLLGPWRSALAAAGLRPGHYRGMTNQELFDNLKKVWRTLGRQPRIGEIHAPISKYSAEPYMTRFGTWCNALRAFDAAVNAKAIPAATGKPSRVSGHINWRLRFQIMQRDHFRCRACGRSPASHPGVTLQIDHRHPRSKGGPSTMENLQTLCETCNGGKSDLTQIPNRSRPQ